jgi:hypothetical protein
MTTPRPGTIVIYPSHSGTENCDHASEEGDTTCKKLKIGAEKLATITSL